MKRVIIPALSALLLAGLPAQAQSIHSHSFQIAQNSRGGGQSGADSAKNDHGRGDKNKPAERATKGGHAAGGGASTFGAGAGGPAMTGGGQAGGAATFGGQGRGRIRLAALVRAVPDQPAAARQRVERRLEPECVAATPAVAAAVLLESAEPPPEPEWEAATQVAQRSLVVDSPPRLFSGGGRRTGTTIRANSTGKSTSAISPRRGGIIGTATIGLTAGTTSAGFSARSSRASSGRVTIGSPTIGCSIFRSRLTATCGFATATTQC